MIFFLSTVKVMKVYVVHSEKCSLFLTLQLPIVLHLDKSFRTGKTASGRTVQFVFLSSMHVIIEEVFVVIYVVITCQYPATVIIAQPVLGIKAKRGEVK